MALLQLQNLNLGGPSVLLFEEFLLVEVLVLADHEVYLERVEPQEAFAACALADGEDEGELVDQLQRFLVGLQAK